MLNTKRLRSVVHSIAHHSVSGLCYIHPHLGQVSKNLGLDRAEIDLLGENTKSQFVEISSEIAGGVSELRELFSTILQSEKMVPGDLSEATALFFFDRSAWPSVCYVRAVSISGRLIDVAVDQTGNPAEIVNR